MNNNTKIVTKQYLIISLNKLKWSNILTYFNFHQTNNQIVIWFIIV